MYCESYSTKKLEGYDGGPGLSVDCQSYIFMVSIINPRRACAARVTVLGLCGVCLRLFSHYRLRGGL